MVCKSRVCSQNKSTKNNGFFHEGRSSTRFNVGKNIAEGVPKGQPTLAISFKAHAHNHSLPIHLKPPGTGRESWHAGLWYTGRDGFTIRPDNDGRVRGCSRRIAFKPFKGIDINCIAG